jgi:hypothetical protein
MSDESVDILGAIAGRILSLPSEARDRGGDTYWGAIRAGQYIDYAIKQGAFQGPEWVGLRIAVDEPSLRRQYDVIFYEAAREILGEDLYQCSIEVFERLCTGIAEAIERQATNDDSARPVSKGRSRAQVKEMAEQWLQRHKAYPGLRELARKLQCSPTTLRQAINMSPKLKAKEDDYLALAGQGTGVSVRATVMSGYTSDSLVSSEPDPAQAAEDREEELRRLSQEQQADQESDRRNRRARART